VCGNELKVKCTISKSIHNLASHEWLYPRLTESLTPMVTEVVI